MNKTNTGTKKYRYLLKWIFWVLLAQLVLINISAALYAYKLTHFYEGAPRHASSKNIFKKTWKLFVGPKFYKNTAEPEPPFPIRTISLKTDNDILIDAWYSTMDSSRTCIIFFHGITVNKSYYISEAAMMRQMGYNVMLVDLRAHGRSGGNTSTFGMKETDEVQKAYNWALANGNDRIILYGGSLGAAICIKAVAEKKVQPAAIIADMPFGSLHHHLVAKASNLGFPSEPFATLVTMWMGFEKGFNGFDHDVSDYARKVNCPALIQWGEEDSYVNRKEVMGVYQNLASPMKKFVSYPHADHESLLKIDPDEWQYQIQTFINSLP